MVKFQHLPILDGWRCTSILFVMAGHTLPLGPGAWRMNGAVATCGMAIFFTLSGFLITGMLLAKPDVPAFLKRRLLRIVPLAWAAMAILIIANRADAAAAAANLFFYANLPPARLLKGGELLWSLCVEVQFYVGVALLVSAFGRRALYALPALALAVTAFRIASDEVISIVTWHRLDEILAGAMLALVHHHRPTLDVPSWAVFVLAPLALLSSHEAIVALQYVRPYLVGAMVGVTIFAAPDLLHRLSTSKAVVWIASISFGLYIVHGMLLETWLGSGDTVVKYAKRPALIAATFLIAHLSYRYYERPMQALGKRLEQTNVTTMSAA